MISPISTSGTIRVIGTVGGSMHVTNILFTEIELRGCVAYARSVLPSNGIHTQMLIEVLERLAEKVPTVFPDVLPASRVYSLPDRIEPELLAMADYHHHRSGNRWSPLARQAWPFNPLQVNMTDVMLAAACTTARSRSSLIANGNKVPIIWACETTSKGLGMVPMNIPQSWMPSGGPTGHPPNKFTSTMMPGGTFFPPISWELGANQLSVLLSGYQLLLMWPPTRKNVSAYRAYWIRNEMKDFHWAMTELEDLEVLVIREPIAFRLGPCYLFSYISLDNSYVVTRSFFSTASTPTAVHTLLRVFAELEAEMNNPNRAPIPRNRRIDTMRWWKTSEDLMNFSCKALLLAMVGQQNNSARERVEQLKRDIETLADIVRRFVQCDHDVVGF
jgi:hypothetical protein